MCEDGRNTSNMQTLTPYISTAIQSVQLTIMMVAKDFSQLPCTKSPRTSYLSLIRFPIDTAVTLKAGKVRHDTATFPRL